jgi:hypothetical protein
MLIRKLTEAIPGEEIEISLWATFNQSKGSAPALAYNLASAKQAGRELRGAVLDDLNTQIVTAKGLLLAADVADEAKLSAGQNAMTVHWHLELITRLRAKFAAHDAEQNPLAVLPTVEENFDPFSSLVGALSLNSSQGPVLIAVVPAPKSAHDSTCLPAHSVYVFPPSMPPGQTSCEQQVADPFAL